MQIEELERLHEAATPGPWQAIGTDPAEGGDWFWIKAQPSPALRGFTKEIAVVNGSQSDPVQQANAALIVALRNALPDIIATYRERDSYKAALEPFGFLETEAQTTQDLWGMIYNDRIQDWIAFEDLDAARTALERRGSE